MGITFINQKIKRMLFCKKRRDFWGRDLAGYSFHTQTDPPQKPPSFWQALIIVVISLLPLLLLLFKHK